MIEFKDLPDTTTPINADNLNNNFDKLKPYVLYNDTNGSSVSITLSDSAQNYEYLEIFFEAEDVYRSEKIFSPNNKIVDCNINVLFGDANYYKNSKWQISGLTISATAGNAYAINIYGFNDFATSTNQVYIHRVVGYK